MTGGAGSDTFVYANGDGNDTITDYVEGEDKIKITSGTISKAKISGKNAMFNVGKGNITIKNAKGKVITIVDASNNETIYLNGKKVDPLNISNSTDYTLISGTAGNDTVSNDGEHVTIDVGSGNDSIANHYSADYVKIFGGKGNDVIYNVCYNVSINGGTGNDSIENYWDSHVSINGGEGDDSIKNFFGSNVTIDAGEGNDSISSDGSNNTIKSGAGNDSVYNWGNYVTINGGAGNDSIESRLGSNVTITGGKGKDFISLNSYYTQNNIIQYMSGDGNDIIFGFNSDDTLQITKGSYKVSTKNNDVFVKVGSGLITLKNAVGKEISIQDSKGNVSTKTYGSSSANIAELFEENNFATANNLSEIVKNNSVATDYNIETNNFNCLTQNDKILTYSSSHSC